MKVFVKRILYFLVAISFLASCKQSTQKTGESSGQDMLNKDEIKAGLQEVAHPLPQPFEVYSMLERIGAKYMEKVPNAVDNADKYFTEKSKAINVGIYAADLGYTATYNNQQAVKSYSTVLKKLLDDLNVKVDYTALQSEEAKDKLADKDSLVAFVTNVYYNSYTFLYKESSPSLAGMMAAGAWVEGLYIASHISDDTYNNYEIVNIIYKQGESLNKLIDLLSSFKDDEMVKSYIGAFNKLKGLYDATNGSLTKEQLQSITTTIETIRESMIS